MKNREIELKLLGELSDLDALAAAPPLAKAGPPRTETLASTYFDAPDRRLAKAGAVLRVRDLEGGRRVQTFKTRGDGLLARGEWETAVASAEPEPRALAGSPLKALLGDDDALDALFTVSVERRTWRLRRKGAEIEVATDRGRVFKSEDPAASLPIAEVELELKSGEPQALFDLAAELMAAAPLRLGVAAKSRRGQALLEGRVNDVARAERVPIGRDASAADAFRAVANACLLQLRLNEDLLLARRDPEALHQLRVAVRRLRSAFSLFAALVAGPRADALKEELKRLSRPLGPARDLDVFLADSLPEELGRRPEETGLLNLEKQLQGDKQKAYEAALGTLRSPEWRCLVVELAGWINAGSWGQPKDEALARRLAQPARRFAREALERRFRQLRRKSRRIAKIDDETRHRARIAAKKLRYGSEFFADLFARKPKREARRAAFLKALKRLQSRLGKLNDVATSHELMADAAKSGRARSAAFAAGLAAADAEARVAPLLAEAKAARKALLKAKPFWA